jgi:hypothetical protein
MGVAWQAGVSLHDLQQKSNDNLHADNMAEQPYKIDAVFARDSMAIFIKMFH